MLEIHQGLVNAVDLLCFVEVFTSVSDTTIYGLPS